MILFVIYIRYVISPPFSWENTYRAVTMPSIFVIYFNSLRYSSVFYLTGARDWVRMHLT